MGSSLSTSPADLNVYALVRPHAIGLTSINVGLWLLSLGLGKTWPVDFIWSSWPIIQSACLAAVADSSDKPRNALVAAAVSIWGLRLTTNFIARGGIGHEDWRYAEMREQQGRFFWVGSLFTVFLAQSGFMFAGCLGLYPALLSTDVASACAPAGAAIMATATLIESTSDKQMDEFVAEQKRLGSSSPAVMDRGLWAWSRHPNYFGEWLFWVGVWTAGGAKVRSYSALGPALMTVLFLGISVGMMEERQLKRRGDVFRSYQRRVPSSFFLMPPLLQRALLGATES